MSVSLISSDQTSLADRAQICVNRKQEGKDGFQFSVPQRWNKAACHLEHLRPADTFRQVLVAQQVF